MNINRGSLMAEQVINTIIIEELLYKVKIIDANSLKTRLSYLTHLFSLSSSVNIIISILCHTPINIYSLVSIGVTCVALEKIKFTVEGHRKSLRSFSNAKTWKDRKLEKDMYESQIQELEKRNLVISSMLADDEHSENNNEEIIDIKKNQTIEDYIVIDGKAVRQYSNEDIISNTMILEEPIVQEKVKQKVKIKR